MLDNVLVAVAYYIGTQKEYDPSIPLAILALVTGSSLILSEIIARTRKRKISPLQPTSAHGNKGKKMVISNLIPFTKLNMTISFGVMVFTIIKLVQKTQIGMPTISIFCSLELLLLLLTNYDAKKHFRRKLAAWRGVDFVEHLELQEIQQIEDQEYRSHGGSKSPVSTRESRSQKYVKKDRNPADMEVVKNPGDLKVVKSQGDMKS